MSYVCFRFNLPIPSVVSGDNLNIPLIGALLRRAGAFFIRRTFAGDKLYTALFDAYVCGLFRAGFCVECFIEGGRSRSGKVTATHRTVLFTVFVFDDAGSLGVATENWLPKESRWLW